VGESVADPAKYYRNNLQNSMALLECVRRHGVPRFVFSSTRAFYGEPERLPLTEDHPRRPVIPHGHTKLAFETMLSDYYAAHGLGSTALRYFKAAGAAPDGSLAEDHHPETHLIPPVLQVALGRRSHIDIFGTDYGTPEGTCIRDYVHVEDLAEAHVLALEKQPAGKKVQYNVGTGTGNSECEVIRTCEEVSGQAIAVREGARRAGGPAAGGLVRKARRPGHVYNVGTGASTTVLDLVNGLNRVMGKDLKPSFVPTRAGDVRYSLVGISRTRSDLGYEPGETFDSGLAKTVEWATV